MASAMIAQSGQNMIGSSAPARRSHALRTTIIVLILLGAMAIGGTLAYRQWVAVSPPDSSTGSGQATTTPATLRPSLIFTESQATLDVIDKDLTTLITKIREQGATNQTRQTINQIIFLRGGSPLIFRLWQDLLELPFPDGLTRIIEPNFMFGFYHSGGGQEPFLIIQTKSPEQAYVQLLAWEKNLPFVWDKLIGKPPAQVLPPTGSSTTEITISTFHAQLIQNLDTRVLEGPGVNQPALYGFLDPQTIILTQSRATFTEVLTRFRKGIN